jgi:hypothetical protein
MKLTVGRAARIAVALALVAGAAAVAAPAHAAPTNTYAVGDVSVIEGNSGPKSRAVYIPVSLSNRGNTSTLSINYSVVQGGGNATAGADFVAKTGTVKFKLGANGSTFVKAQIVVKLIADTAIEGDETFEVQLSNPQGGGGFTAAKSTGIVTIVDDDPSAGVVASVGDATIYEGDDGNYARNTKLVISLSQPATATVLVTWNVFSTGATCAKAYYGNPTVPDQDCVAYPRDKVTKFAVGSSGFTGVTKTANVGLFVDTVDEPDETFEVRILNVSGGGAVPGDAIGVGTIIDDDDPV